MASIQSSHEKGGLQKKRGLAAKHFVTPFVFFVSFVVLAFALHEPQRTQRYTKAAEGPNWIGEIGYSNPYCAVTLLAAPKCSSARSMTACISLAYFTSRPLARILLASSGL